MIKKFFEKGRGFTYDTSKIKSRCVDCKRKLIGNLEENYIVRGNYCSKCNTIYSEMRYVKKINESENQFNQDNRLGVLHNEDQGELGVRESTGENAVLFDGASN